MEISKQMPLTTISRNDLLKECRAEYSDDEIELYKIQEFADNYHSDNVIRDGRNTSHILSHTSHI